ncbi:biotin-dependent carboxyltransferase family protein [Niallia sp. Krafla_26]|uniref:5-oxoprolinase subunit C family protein n=1 Tax=Niallia sp. Krafla_26 TaxID=3064703 RepID=UPI003D17736C
MITILKPGFQTTIQDLGRFGYQKYGVITSGAMDSISFRLANLLVGNEENESALEMTIQGPHIVFGQDSLIAITGGDLSPTINQTPIPLWKIIFVKKGTELKFNRAQTGCRAYLAIAGGFSIPKVMTSASTYLRANIGGFKGRTLRAGDQLSLYSPSPRVLPLIEQARQKVGNLSFIEKDWSISTNYLPDISSHPVIRIIKGREYHLFTEESQHLFFHESFSITPHSDRMGYRLQGPSLRLENKQEMISTAVTFGSIQVPSAGNPIILMADRQTTGGYPIIGQVASVDLPLISQTKPGDLLSFSEITLKEAQLLYLKREQNLRSIKQAILQKFQEV